MKNQFVTGLIMILPLTITIIFVIFLINFLTNPFLSFVSQGLIHFELISPTHPYLIHYASRVLILVFLFGFTLFLGILGSWFFQKYLIAISDYIFHRIPFINKIYRACQDVVHTLLTTKSESFKQVVMVPYPHVGSLSLGLVAQNTLPEGTDAIFKDKVAVLVPGAPNPTVGFVLLYDRSQIKNIDMKIDDAIKSIVSCGAILADISLTTEKK